MSVAGSGARTHLATRRRLAIGLATLIALFASKGDGGIATAQERFTAETNSQPNALHLVRSLVLSARGYVTGVAWSRDGSRLAAISDFGRKITAWRADGMRLTEFDRLGPYVDNSIAFLSNDTILTAASRSTAEEERLAFTLWSVATGKTSRTIEGPAPGKPGGDNQADHFAISPDGETVAATVPDINQPITLYSLRDRTIVGSIPVSGHDSATSVAFSPDGGTLAVGLISGQVKLFDLKHLDAAPSAITAYSGAPETGVESLSFSPDGRFLATGATVSIGNSAMRTDETERNGTGRTQAPIKIWGVADHRVIAAYPGDLAPVRELSWSADSRYLAAAAGDNKLRVFTPDQPDKPVAVDPARRRGSDPGCLRSRSHLAGPRPAAGAPRRL